MASSAGDRNVKMMTTPLVVNFILNIFYLAVYGYGSSQHIFLGIPNSSVGFLVTISYLTAAGILLGLIFTIIGVMFVVQLASGASILGTGTGKIGGTMVLIIVQYIPMSIMYAFTAFFAEILLVQIPYSMGSVLQVVLGVSFFLGLLLHQRAGGSALVGTTVVARPDKFVGYPEMTVEETIATFSHESIHDALHCIGENSLLFDNLGHQVPNLRADGMNNRYWKAVRKYKNGD
jgi:hypothetical protein